jgi:hypothetical protein
MLMFHPLPIYTKGKKRGVLAKIAREGKNNAIRCRP